MTVRYVATALVLVLLAAGAVFQLKYRMVQMEAEQRSLAAQIEAERWALQTRRADLAYLTWPDRLAVQAAQLGMRPGTADRIVQVAQIGDRQQLELASRPVLVQLPSGAEVALRLRPIQLLGGQGKPR